MNREIKFRIWDHEVERMNDWDWVESSFMHIGEVFNNDLYTVMFYTGLKDKDGIPIYEGDILEVETIPGNTIRFLVKFVKGSFVADNPEVQHLLH